MKVYYIPKDPYDITYVKAKHMRPRPNTSNPNMPLGSLSKVSSSYGTQGRSQDCLAGWFLTLLQKSQ
ncbi:hypothetical protein PRUPE_5G245800 [Prunus persica]|uniref:Uncharacterized protein n=1 Tax=Prunus persica TaxID=3760 RepID=A0A251PDD1_PRUPE|nr:hypothetical protein PRUPE_5G245800 [Prunus persica]